ncbi:Sarcoplasmic/endoplasmic reticulum calcium ATPase 2, partial [Conglomerata obtusa]
CNNILMTGDGINDILALQKSDLSFAMGSGADLCKEKSDVILLDDNFTNIVESIISARKALHNVFCLLKYLISSNIGEVLCVFFCFIFNTNSCLASKNLLLINLITDGLPASFLCFNNVKVKKNQKFFRIEIMLRIIFIGIYSGISTFLFYLYYLLYDKTGPMISFANRRNISMYHQSKGTTICTIFVIFLEIINSLNNISIEHSVFSKKTLKRNKYICSTVVLTIFLTYYLTKFSFTRVLFGFEEISLSMYVNLLLFALPVLFIDEMFKLKK